MKTGRKEIQGALTLLLLGISCGIALFLVDGYIGRYVNFGDSPVDPQVPFFGRQAPNASYTHAFEGFAFSVQHNSDGFREKELTLRPLKQGQRILCLGDSFTYGWGVDRKDSWPRLVEAQLRQQDPESQWEVLNLGMTGTSPLYYRDVLLAYGPLLEPDIVLVGLYQNNDAIGHYNAPNHNLRRPRLYEKIRIFSPIHLSAYLRNHWNLWRNPDEYTGIPNPIAVLQQDEDAAIQQQLQQIPSAHLEKVLQWKLPPYTLARLIRDPDVLAWDIKQCNYLLERPAMRQVLQEMQQTAAQWNGELRILVFPQGWTLDKRIWPELQSVGATTRPALLQDCHFQDSIRHFSEELGVSMLDLRGALLAESAPCFLPWDEHMNATGNAVCAKAITDWLRTDVAPVLEERPAPFSAITPIVEWDFDGDKAQAGWTLWPREHQWKEEGGCARIRYGKHCEEGKPVAFMNRNYTLDCSKVNRLRIRMRSQRGHFARFLWGSEPHFSPKRTISFPIISDGAFHEYDIALDHGVADWEKKWKGIRIEPAYAWQGEADMTGEIVEIDYVLLGYATPEKSHPDIWTCARP